jgi:hypothetical protein
MHFLNSTIFRWISLWENSVSPVGATDNHQAFAMEIWR